MIFDHIVLRYWFPTELYSHSSSLLFTLSLSVTIMDNQAIRRHSLFVRSSDQEIKTIELFIIACPSPWLQRDGFHHHPRHWLPNKGYRLDICPLRLWCLSVNRKQQSAAPPWPWSHSAGRCGRVDQLYMTVQQQWRRRSCVLLDKWHGDSGRPLIVLKSKPAPRPTHNHHRLPCVGQESARCLVSSSRAGMSNWQKSNAHLLSQ